MYKIWPQRYFFKLATNGQSDKAFLLASGFCPQRVVCPWAIYMWKNIKNAYKIRIQRDLFETCKKWSKWYGLSVDIKSLFPSGFLPLPRGLYTCIRSFKMCLKSYFKGIVLKLATNEQSDKGFLLTSTFVPEGLSAPAFGLYTSIKALKYIPGPGVR